MKRVNLALKFYFKNKLSKYNLILISISILIILISNVYSYSANNYLKSKSINNSVWFKSLEVFPKDKTLDEGIDEIMNISHVTNAIKYNFYSAIMHSNILENDKLSGEVLFYFSNNDSLPKIVKGTDFPKEEGNFIICPQKLYSVSGLDSLQYINIKYANNMNDYLNKEIEFNYKSLFGTNEYKENYKLVGLYKPRDPSESNICFVKNDNLLKIINNQYSDYIDEETGMPVIDNQTSILIQFDDIKNLSKIKSSLDELGYKYNTTSIVIEDYFNDINNFASNITIITNIIIFVLIFILLLKQFKDEKKLLKLLNILGYKKIDILYITFITNIILIFMSVVISNILFLIIFTLGNTLIYYYPFLLNGWKFSINYRFLFSILYTLVILTIIISIIKYVIIKKELK